ncbi:hypothetical protein V6N11_038439 [Hibiscus sabdariffa]|uniref:Uncharacterized protein n=1 Tax=Hibiscus sabdariffa TaxID=183260 RepID=A0ABR2SJY9_9ROSI
MILLLLERMRYMLLPPSNVAKANIARANVMEVKNNSKKVNRILDTIGTSGYVFTLGGRAVSWKSSRQTVITRSTMESEFVALDKSREEAEWL